MLLNIIHCIIIISSIIEAGLSLTVNWQLITADPKLKQVSIGSDADIRGVDNADKIYQYNGDHDQSWSTMTPDSRLSQISVGDAHIMWGVNSHDYIFEYNGNHNNGWTRITPDSRLSHVSVGNDGTVWGVSNADLVYQYDANNHKWSQMTATSRLSQISVGSAFQVAGVNKNGELFKWNGEGWDMPEANGYKFRYVDISSDGDMWAIEWYYGFIYRYCQSNGSGYWQRAVDDHDSSFTLKQIENNAGTLIGVDGNGKFYTATTPANTCNDRRRLIMNENRLNN